MKSSRALEQHAIVWVSKDAFVNNIFGYLSGKLAVWAPGQHCRHHRASELLAGSVVEASGTEHKAPLAQCRQLPCSSVPLFFFCVSESTIPAILMGRVIRAGAGNTQRRINRIPNRHQDQQCCAAPLHIKQARLLYTQCLGGTQPYRPRLQRHPGAR